MMALYLLWFGSAHAVDAKFCAKITTSFSSLITEDDIYSSNWQRKARGVHLRIMDIDEPDPQKQVLYDGFAPWQGSEAGCTSVLSLRASRTYWADMYGESLVRGDRVRIVIGTTETRADLAFIKTTSDIDANGVIKLLADAATHGTRWNNLAVGSRLLARTDMGIGHPSCSADTDCTAGAGMLQGVCQQGACAQVFTLHDTSCGGGTSTSSCLSGVDHHVWTGSGSKWVIAHEMGHYIAYVRDGYNHAKISYNLIDPYCKAYRPPGKPRYSHAFVSKEYQSSAANEGFAHFIAAMAWNNTSESDCWYRYYKKSDWDQSGSPLDLMEDDSSNLTLRCDIGPNPSVFTAVDRFDYLGDWCLGNLDNRGTEYDWLRFFWDLVTVEGLSVREVIDIYESANPSTWNADDSGASVYNNPYNRFYGAASFLGYGEACTRQAGQPGGPFKNGVFR